MNYGTQPRCGGLGTHRLDSGIPFLSAGFHRHGEKSDDQFRRWMAKYWSQKTCVEAQQ